jgi:hypothetical protein
VENILIQRGGPILILFWRVSTLSLVRINPVLVLALLFQY